MLTLSIYLKARDLELFNKAQKLKVDLRRNVQILIHRKKERSGEHSMGEQSIVVNSNHMPFPDTLLGNYPL